MTLYRFLALLAIGSAAGIVKQDHPPKIDKPAQCRRLSLVKGRQPSFARDVKKRGGKQLRVAAWNSDGIA